MSFLDKLFGTYSSRELKNIYPIQKEVLALEDKYTAMTDAELKATTPLLKEKLANGATLDDILPDAFAACREASWRVVNMKHFPVQVIGGIVLHQGRIAEMRTGEGKTLVATLPAYLNALEGKGVHIITVNDYLAKRDSEWMGKIYRYMGLSVGLCVHGMNPEERKIAYDCDITYGTNNEFGFDYLRDNMQTYKERKVQRGHRYVILDEVDSILIDEARTPLIISGEGDKSTDMYTIVDKFAKGLKMFKMKEMEMKEEHDDIDADYIVDEKAKTASITPQGVKKAEEYFNIPNLMDIENSTLQHHINQALKALGTMQRDVDYVVKDDEIIIVDQFTGRMMMGRRYSEGLHQAIEAKEGVEIKKESKTLATITYQNLFRMYDKLAGMTGTAMTEEGEFREIYSLDVIDIPTNKEVLRDDLPDIVYKTEQAKFNAVIDDIIERHKTGQPVLVGTVSIDKSEHLSGMLNRRGIKHNVLNAKYHEREAVIISQAGKFGAVTIATNMAGRGTDIMLGGNAEFLAKSEMAKQGFSDELINEATGFGDTDNEEILTARQVFSELNKKHKEEIEPEAAKVREAGGLAIIGTERHESRRIDNQLRGRAGRQGDPGCSRFYLSLEDDLMRLFGGEKINTMMETLKIEEDTPIETRILTSTIQSAQNKIEGRNFSIRKNVLQFDDVMNTQRKIIYAQRDQVLEGVNLRENMVKMIAAAVQSTVNTCYTTDNETRIWNVDMLKTHYMGMMMGEEFFTGKTEDDWKQITPEKLTEQITERAMSIYNAREAQFGEEAMRELERVLLLKQVDTKWIEHLDNMDELKRGIGLRGYAQRDPVVEFRIEGSDMFEEMIASIQEETVRWVLFAIVRAEQPMQREQVAKPIEEIGSGQPVKVTDKTGRNDLCPCGSGKKYKKCCGANS
ncbi:MAG: preprotein translocase subunit SecA [Oscillospiraceae bacterium]